MNSITFIEAISKIMKSALSGLSSSIQSPPGRRPTAQLVRVSELYKKLSEDDRDVFNEALELAAKQSTNNLLAVLDGSLAVELYREETALELYYSDGQTKVRLNDPEETPLSEIFRSQT